MRLSTRPLHEAIGYFFSIAKWPFFITLILSIAAALMGGSFSEVFLSAISGQLAITLLKLTFYLGLILLPLAFAMRLWPLVFRPLHSVGDIVAGISFACAAGATGVAAGLIGGLGIEVGLVKASAAVFYLVFLLTAISTILWIAAAAPHHVTPATQVWEAAAFTVVALFLSALSSTALYCETWPEIEALNLQRDNFVCKRFQTNDPKR